MIKVKHICDAVEEDDGLRMWVEPIGLVKDLQQWCRINHVMPHLGPPKDAWDRLAENPDSYEEFRGAVSRVPRPQPLSARTAKAGLRRDAGKLHPRP